MNKNHKETISIRFISTAFMILAIAIFKPFGLEVGQWQSYLHLLCLFVLGLFSCFITEVILRYMVHMPRSYERGINYIISRNLRFQLINTPLVALLICLYRHFVMSHQVDGNQLSWSNYLETLVIIAFLSFAIGLYWRFKFRSRYLAAELEETRQLNEQLSKIKSTLATTQREMSSTTHQESSSSGILVGDDTVTLEGTTNESVTLHISNLLYLEAVGNYVKVCHLCDGEVRRDVIRSTLKQLEDNLKTNPMMVRCHRAFLVNLAQVEQISSNSRSMQLIIRHNHDAVPVSRSNVSQIKEAIRKI